MTRRGSEREPTFLRKKIEAFLFYMFYVYQHILFKSERIIPKPIYFHTISKVSEKQNT